MYRLMQPSDEAAVVALWQKERGDSAEFIKTALEKFAGAENIYVAEENDEIVAAALAVPVTLKGRSGSYLYGLCGQGSLLLAGLVDYLCPEQMAVVLTDLYALCAAEAAGRGLHRGRSGRTGAGRAAGKQGFPAGFCPPLPAPGGVPQPVESGGVRLRDGPQAL